MTRTRDELDTRRARARFTARVHIARRAAAGLALGVLAAASAGSDSADVPAGADPAAVLPPRLYDLTIETGMPHLDENLRYATTHARRCVRGDDLARLFPILQHVALQDCSLAPTEADEFGPTFALRCTGGHGTTGEARWQLGEAEIAGTLSVRLGGKNMTFHQRITGRAIGPCDEPAAARGEGAMSAPGRSEALIPERVA